MAKFMVLYKSSASADEQMAGGTAEQRAAAMDLWQKWGAKAGGAIVDFGSPLADRMEIPATAAQRKHIGGYAVLEAGSADEIASLLEGHPHFHAPDASIEVLEILPVPGMGA